MVYKFSAWDFAVGRDSITSLKKPTQGKCLVTLSCFCLNTVSIFRLTWGS